MVMRLPIAIYGRREVTAAFILWFVLSIPFYFLSPLIPLFLLAVPAAVLVFFRDPHRSVSAVGPGVVLSPADGRVADIREVDRAPYLESECLCIGIFMSVLNVHVNRSPLAGEVEYVEHVPGRHHDARNAISGSENEHNHIGIAVCCGGRVLVKQIAGLIARRIVCEVGPGDKLERGQKIGMIKFGSRLEVYIPLACGPAVGVKVGDRVKAGIDVLARMDLTERA